MALLAALIGPFFIDWTAYRSTFEAYGERVLGHRVVVRGDADMRLLPIPTLTFTDVRVGEIEDPLLAVSRFVVRVELPPLLKGEVKVLDMTMERPDLRLSLDEAGRLDWFTAAPRQSVLSEIDPEKVTLEQVEIVDGTATLIDARNGKSHSITDIDALVTARSLLGPFKVDGTATMAGERATVRLATGRQQDTGDIRLKSQVTPVSVPAEFLFDGKLSHTDGRPSYEGVFTANSITPEEERHRAWRAEGEYLLDVGEIAFSELVARYGPEERPVTVEGEGKILLSGEEPRFDVTARAKQIDIDRLLGAGPQEPIEISDAISQLLAALPRMPRLPLEGHAVVDIPATVVGGGIVQDLTIDAKTAGTGWNIAELRARLPGRSDILLRGDLKIEPSPSFRGSFAASLEQPNGFADWYRKGVALAEPVAPLALQSRLDAGPSGVSLSDLEFHLADHVGRGTFRFTAEDDTHNSLYADLDAERVDLDQVALLARLFLADPSGGLAGFAGANTDIVLKLYSDAVAAGGVTASDVTIDAAYSGDVLTVNDVTARDIAGARISAKGFVSDLSTSPQGDLRADVEASDLTGLARLLGTIAPENPAVSALKRTAGALSPAELDLRFTGEGQDEGTEARLQVSGTAGGSDVSLSAGLNGRLDSWREADLDISGKLAGPDGAKLLKQAGFRLLPVASLGEGRISFGMRGVPADVVDARLRAEADGASVLAVGKVSAGADEPYRYTGNIVLKAEDITPFALLAGRMPPLLAGDASVDLAMSLDGEGDAFQLRDIAGEVAGTRIRADVNGDLRRDIADLLPKFTGSLALSDLDMRFVSELLLGADQWSSVSADSNWPEGSFGAEFVDGIDVSLDLAAEKMTLGGGLSADNASGRLRLKPGDLLIEADEAGFAGGKLAGSLSIKRSRGQAAVNGSVRISSADVSSLVWRRDGRPLATGALDVNADFEGAGRSINGLVASLSGGGTFKAENGEIRGLNPDAFGLVIRAADAGLDLEDGKISDAFESHLDVGVLPYQAIDGSFVIAGGVARIRNVSVDNKLAALFGNAQVDLAKETVSGDFSLKVDPGENAVTGAEPQVGIVLEGPLYEPRRHVDIAPFTAFLTLRAFEQEVQRVEQLQAEILERDRLVRELRRLKEERERQAREEEEAARRAEEAAAKAAEGEGSEVPAGDDDPAPSSGGGKQSETLFEPLNGGVVVDGDNRNASIPGPVNKPVEVLAPIVVNEPAHEAPGGGAASGAADTDAAAGTTKPATTPFEDQIRAIIQRESAGDANVPEAQPVPAGTELPPLDTRVISDPQFELPGVRNIPTPPARIDNDVTGTVASRRATSGSRSAVRASSTARSASRVDDPSENYKRLPGGRIIGFPSNR
ncbi:AsmA family protein [Stappia sp. GBMRC 2046]|uniref:AsmA family protein n=1 Tax=Stappia sediminis TaxID=2692190 RepID=A0A7X3S5Y0_9HYPH|nr:AsmA family protein [Stappia sediminis]